MAKTNLPKAVCVVGPTAAGKTRIGVTLAKRFNGEIVSADSRQVYKHLDLCTGKDKRDYRSGKKAIPYHLIDILEPKEEFSSAEFQAKSYKIISGVLRRGKLPLLVGGSPFYIYAVTEGWKFPKIQKDERLRRKLDKMTHLELLVTLEKVDPKAYQIVDQKNRRRIQRAIEVCILSGKSFEESKLIPNPKFDFLRLGISFPIPELKKRIEKRLQERLNEGMIEEVKKVLKTKKAEFKDLEKMGLEPRFIAYYLQNKITREELQELLVKNILSFARRQMNWFRKDKKIIWIKDEKEAEKYVEEFV